MDVRHVASLLVGPFALGDEPPSQIGAPPWVLQTEAATAFVAAEELLEREQWEAALEQFVLVTRSYSHFEQVYTQWRAPWVAGRLRYAEDRQTQLRAVLAAKSVASEKQKGEQKKDVPDEIDARLFSLRQEMTPPQPLLFVRIVEGTRPSQARLSIVWPTTQIPLHVL